LVFKLSNEITGALRIGLQYHGMGFSIFKWAMKRRT
jgi:hypothetical protein